jgi:hypothetical protein
VVQIPEDNKSICKLHEKWESFPRVWADEATLVTGDHGIASDDLEDMSAFAGAFDKRSSRTLTALRAYKCNHQGKGFSMAKGLRSAFKSYFEMYVPICLHVSVS